MRRMAAGILAVGLGLALAGCGDDEDGARAPECGLFPDTCEAGLQCFPGTPDPALTVCLAEGPRQQGETCDSTSEDASLYCGRELLCVAYGEQGQIKKCSPLCETDADCQGKGLTSRCSPGVQTGLKFCAL